MSGQKCSEGLSGERERERERYTEAATAAVNQPILAPHQTRDTSC